MSLVRSQPGAPIYMKNTLIPVIHLVSEAQVFRNIDTCLECGISKVFLINHMSSWHSLISCAKEVKNRYKLWLGANMLDVSTKDALSREDDLFDAIWCDASISKEEVKMFRKFKGLYFGGLAFKYQPQPINIELACQDAIESIDVPTTSGVGTGKAAALDKIKEIKIYLGEHPLALASGVSIENIEMYKPYVDYFLVASSITDEGEIINKDKLMRLNTMCNLE